MSVSVDVGMQSPEGWLQSDATREDQKERRATLPPEVAILLGEPEALSHDELPTVREVA